MIFKSSSPSPIREMVKAFIKGSSLMIVMWFISYHLSCIYRDVVAFSMGYLWI